VKLNPTVMSRPAAHPSTHAFGLVAAGLAIAAILAIAACATESEPEVGVDAEPAADLPVSREAFGTLPDGRQVDVFTLRNDNGVVVRVIDYGGIVLSITAPDRDGNAGDIVLGYDELDGYLAATPYFGAIIGRYGNRIAGARFTLDGATYELAANNDPNHLHGGEVGFDKVLWNGEIVDTDAGAGVRFTYTSLAGEEGYPGNLDATVDYMLNEDNELVIDYRATSDAPTPINLTHHSYFNLAGGGDILGHELQINADRYTPVDETLIPTGELAAVAGTPFDFTEPTAIGARIDADGEQLRRGGGYDHNFVLQRGDAGASISADGALAEMLLAARVTEPVSGRVLEVETSEPGLQFYSGNFLDGTITGKDGRVYEHRSGFCLEPQHFPDSPNQAAFPPTILRPGEIYRSRTIYRFAVQR
jgi:aldose 1-epimerase